MPPPITNFHIRDILVTLPAAAAWRILGRNGVGPARVAVACWPTWVLLVTTPVLVGSIWAERWPWVAAVAVVHVPVLIYGIWDRFIR